MSRYPESLSVRFWKKVEKTNGCWRWPGSKSEKGYGRLKTKGKIFLIHRLSYEFHNGPIPEGMCVLHTCDNPECANPNHLFLGTRGDNNRDRNKKGRDARGEKNNMAILSEMDVKKIRGLLIKGISKKALALEFGTHLSTIYLIANRKIWKHI
jgi:hypothetical protein